MLDRKSRRCEPPTDSTTVLRYIATVGNVTTFLFFVGATRRYLWQPIRYAVVFTGGITLSTWVNARVNRRNDRIRQQYLNSGLAKVSLGNAAAVLLYRFA